MIDPLGLCSTDNWRDGFAMMAEWSSKIRVGKDIGIKEYEEDFDSIEYRKTGLYRIRIEYVEDPHSILLQIKNLIPQLRGIPLGVYERRVYVDVQMGEHKVYYRIDTRIPKAREMAYDSIPGGDTFYKHSKNPRHIDYGIHPLKPVDREIVDIKESEIDKVLEDIEKGQLREVLYDQQWRN